MFILKNGLDCPYRNQCKYFTEDGKCSKMCVKFHRINKLLTDSMIPTNYIQPYKLIPAKEDYEMYEILNLIKQNIKTNVEEGRNFLITGEKKFNGKTSWGIKILKTYFHQIMNENGNSIRGLYIDILEYFIDLKGSFDEMINNDEVFTQKQLTEIDLIVWDNLDTRTLSDFERNTLIYIIKKRISNGKANIFITNNVNRNLMNRVGEILKLYIQDSSEVLNLVGGRGDKK